VAAADDAAAVAVLTLGAAISAHTTTLLRDSTGPDVRPPAVWPARR
jgi:hypothetical protein